MKLVIATCAVFFAAAIAQADLNKPATLDVKCVTTEPKVIQIFSDSNGSTVSVDGKIVMELEQLAGGTEGGAPYLQAVGGGYNITIFGGAFEQAFNASAAVNGLASALVDSPNSSAEAACEGTFAF